MKALLTAVSVGALLISAPVWAQNAPAQNVPAQTAPAQNTPAHSQNMPAQSQNMPAANQNKTARNTAEPQSWNSQDKSFVDTAASGNLAEAELGRLAWTKSNQPAIK